MSRILTRLILVICALAMASAPDRAWAQGLSALAFVDPERSEIADTRSGVELQMGLSQPVPFRVFTLDAPRRLVLDFSELRWDGLDAEVFDRSEAVSEVAMGQFRPGWTRMVMVLDAPLIVDTAGMRTELGEVVVSVALVAATAEAFAEKAGAPPSARFSLPLPADIPLEPRTRQTGDRPLVVALDPGHGGIDPGAERGGVVEAELMLTFARELKDVLIRAGNFEVVMTREDDRFVPLEARQSIARAAGADVFISLHADALAEGRASGATIYTLSESASDLASAKLAERHDRGDLLAGVDLSNHDDQVASVLMELARRETAPRSDKLAAALEIALGQAIGNLHKRPRLTGSFSVLKAADIPSVLLELGFLSSARDRENLTSAVWRLNAARGIRDALRAWAIEDAADAALIRQ